MTTGTATTPAARARQHRVWSDGLHDPYSPGLSVVFVAVVTYAASLFGLRMLSDGLAVDAGAWPVIAPPVLGAATGVVMAGLIRRWRRQQRAALDLSAALEALAAALPEAAALHDRCEAAAVSTAWLNLRECRSAAADLRPELDHLAAHHDLDTGTRLAVNRARTLCAVL